MFGWLWLSNQPSSAVKQFLVKFFQQFVLVVIVFVFWIAAGAGAITAASDI